MTEYTIDTNVLAWMNRNLPRDIFPGPWRALEELVSAGRCCICEAVHDETKLGTDELHNWAKQLNGFICKPNEAEVATVATISTRHSNWVRQTKNAADPWIVAHANEHASRTIVSTEKTMIPMVAQEFGLTAIDFFRLAGDEGWSF